MVSVGTLQDKLRCISSLSDGTDLYFEGCNVHVVSGSGSTDATPTNGLGNLFVGYNEPGTCPKEANGVCRRDGSHNLIIGTRHGYASYGGVVGGSANVARSVLTPF